VIRRQSDAQITSDFSGRVLTAGLADAWLLSVQAGTGHGVSGTKAGSLVSPIPSALALPPKI